MATIRLLRVLDTRKPYLLHDTSSLLHVSCISMARVGFVAESMSVWARDSETPRVVGGASQPRARIL